MSVESQTLDLSQDKKAKLYVAFNDQWKLTNPLIWGSIIGAVSKSRSSHYLLASERDRIIQAYEETHLQDVAAAELVQKAEVADLHKHPFLNKVCFNYDYEIGGEKRCQQALEELAAGKRECVHYDIEGTENWPLQKWVEDCDLGLLQRMKFVRRQGAINSAGCVEEAFCLTGHYQTKLDRVIDGVAIFSIVGIPFLILGGGSQSTFGYGEIEDLENYHSGHIFPLLDKNSLVKAVPSHKAIDHMDGFVSVNPTIIKKVL